MLRVLELNVFQHFQLYFILDFARQTIPDQVENCLPSMLHCFACSMSMVNVYAGGGRHYNSLSHYRTIFDWLLQMSYSTFVSWKLIAAAVFACSSIVPSVSAGKFSPITL